MTRRAFLASSGIALASLLVRRVRTPAQQAKPIRLSMMPAQDVVPLAFALEQGIFNKYGVNVELVCGGNALERNTAFLGGQLDALAVDLTGAVLLLGRQAPAAIVGTVFEPTPDPRHGNSIVRTLAMLTHKFSSYRSVEDIIKSGPKRQITMVQPSDMEYLTDKLLQSKGVKSRDVDYYYTGVEDFDKIQVIAQLLGAGTVSVQVAILPEPHATLTEVVAEANAVEIITLSDYKGLRVPPSVLLFSRQVLGERGESVRRFFQAFKESVTTLNTSARDFIIDALIRAGVNICFPELRGQELKFPDGWRERLRVPYFPQPRALRADEFEAHVSWALEKRYIREKIAFASVTDFRFLG
jgi:NitT/TauT family transport system substrate-binding protein